MNSKYQQFREQLPFPVKTQVRLARFSAIKVGGPADLLVEARTQQALIDAVRLAKQLGITYLVIAGASNVFFDDKGFRGLIIRFLADNIEIDRAGQAVTVEAGCDLNKLVLTVANHNLGGIDFLANIPGSVGGAVVGNAGCYGREIREILVSADIFDITTGRTSTWDPAQFHFVYRHSRLKDDATKIVLACVLRVVSERKQTVIKAVRAEKQLRLDKHPHAPSVGSFFKNPERGVPAWKFIDQAGLRGLTLGGARISKKHSNHIINVYHASSRDVIRLAQLMARKVKQVTGIVLEPEARYVSPTGIKPIV